MLIPYLRHGSMETCPSIFKWGVDNLIKGRENIHHRNGVKHKWCNEALVATMHRLDLKFQRKQYSMVCDANGV